MSGVSKVEIHEAAAELLHLMKQQRQQRQPKLRSRVQALYLLKSGEATSVTQAARMVGYSRTMVQRW